MDKHIYEKTKYLKPLDDCGFGENILDRSIDEVLKEIEYILYAYLEIPKHPKEGEKTQEDIWANPTPKGDGRYETVHAVKIGMIGVHEDAYLNKGLTVREALCKRVDADFRSNSLLNTYSLVFCVPSNNTDTHFRDFLWNHCIKMPRDGYDGENVGYLNKHNIKRYYNDYKNGIRRTENFKMWEAQKKLFDKLVNYFENLEEGDEPVFLIAAKPRFGKNFPLLKFIKYMKFRLSVFSSYLPTVFDGLEDNVVNHVDFDGLDYVDYRKCRDFEVVNPTIASTSAQLLNYEEKDTDDSEIVADVETMVNYKKSLITLRIKGVDCLVIDEAHFGGKTNNMQEIIDTLNPKITIFVTGTASKYEYDERFSEKNTFSYDYWDECEDESEHAKRMPKFKIYSYEMDSKMKAECKDEYSVEEYPSFRKLFAVDNGKFVRKHYVEEHFRAVFGKITPNKDRGYKVTEALIKCSPYCNEELDGKINHSLWLMPSVASCKAGKKLLKNIVGDEFYIIDASGSDGVREINEVKKYINKAKADRKKTITLTCQRFREGVTVPDWNAVFLFDDGHSYDRMLQTMFRVQSYDDNKPFCYVFDYNIERSLLIRYDMIYKHRKNGLTVEQMEKKLCDCMPIICYGKTGELYENNVVLEKLRKIGRIHYSKGFNGFGASIVNGYSIVKHHESAYNTLKNVIATIGNRATTVLEVSTNGLTGGKVYEHMSKMVSSYENEDFKGYEKEYKKLVNACIEISHHMPEFWFVLDGKYTRVEDTLISEYSDVFERITGIKMEDFSTMLENGIFNREVFDDMLEQFNRDKEEKFDFAVAFQDSTEDHDYLISQMDEFHRMWIYENEPETIDISYLLAKETV